jgi:integrase
MKVNYYLNRPNEKSSIIVLSAHWHNKRIRISTGISVNPKQWDSKNQKPKRNAIAEAELNNALVSIRNSIESFFLRKKAVGEIIPLDQMKEHIQRFLRPEKYQEPEEKTFLDYFDEFIQRRNNDSRFKQTTIKGYKTAFNHLKDFKEATNFDLRFENMNDDFYGQFLTYLSSKNIVNTTQGNQIRIIKTFLSDAMDRGLHNDPYFIKNFKASKKDGQQVALTFEELEAIEKYKPDTDRLQSVKDCFLLQCYTALRYSDLKKLKSEHINIDDSTISIFSEKTKVHIRIPIHNRLKELLQKYKNVGLKVITSQKYNSYIKELCKHAGIITPVTMTKEIGKEIIEETKPKYEEISSHTGRRTFITHMILKGKAPEVIMKITGHTTRSSFEKYVRVTQDQALKEIMDAWDR